MNDVWLFEVMSPFSKGACLTNRVVNISRVSIQNSFTRKRSIAHRCSFSDYSHYPRFEWDNKCWESPSQSVEDVSRKIAYLKRQKESNYKDLIEYRRTLFGRSFVGIIGSVIGIYLSPETAAFLSIAIPSSIATIPYYHKTQRCIANGHQNIGYLKNELIDWIGKCVYSEETAELKEAKWRKYRESIKLLEEERQLLFLFPLNLSRFITDLSKFAEGLSLSQLPAKSRSLLGQIMTKISKFVGGLCLFSVVVLPFTFSSFWYIDESGLDMGDEGNIVLEEFIRAEKKRMEDQRMVVEELRMVVEEYIKARKKRMEEHGMGTVSE